MYIYCVNSCLSGDTLVTCDDRENKRVRNALRKYFPDMNVSRLDIADFVDDDLGFCIERKGILDMSSSITDGRVFRQAREMRDSYEHCFIIQVGTYEAIRTNRYHKNMSINRFIGALSDLAMLYKVDVLQCENLSQYARYVDSLYRKVGKETPIRKEKRHKKIKTNQTLSCLLGLEGIGEKRARDILKQYPTIGSICKASVEDLATVRGIGKKRSKAIKEIFR